MIGFPDDTTLSFAHSFADDPGLRSILHLHSFLPHDEAVRTMRASDALLILLGEREFSRMAVSSKIYEYLRCGRPILAVAYPGDLAEIVRASGGMVLDPEDPAAIAAALVGLAEGSAPVSPCPAEFAARFRYDRLAAQLGAVLDEVITRPRRRSSPVQAGRGTS
jgi:glycosyltransferase involved in cell wall biosynthesis